MKMKYERRKEKNFEILLTSLFAVARLAQKFERIEYRGDWHAQTLRTDIIGTPALDVPIAFYQARNEPRDPV